jgi:hypothetical protein
MSIDPHPKGTPNDPYVFVCRWCGKVYDSFPVDESCARWIVSWETNRLAYRDGKLVGLRIAKP